jgi:glycosyltransferase involved in cell wall biosynthesis
MRKTICVLSFSPIASDARVLRQIKYLSLFYDLTIIGYGPEHTLYPESGTIRWIQLDQQAQPVIPNLVTALKTREFNNILSLKRVQRKLNNGINRALLLLGNISPIAYETWYGRQKDYQQALRHAVDLRCNAFLANDWETLPIAATAARMRNTPVVLDLHEYSPLEFENRPRWWIQKGLISYILKKYACRANAITTVARLIAERYRDEFGLDPVIIMNAPEQLPDLPHETPDGTIKLIHHGVASHIRHPELMIDTIARCDQRYSLHFMFLKNEYVQELQRLAEQKAPGRVTFHDPVPPQDITKTISCYDVGFFPIPPVNYNYHACLPNKFFDFICSGLAVCIGPSPSMAEIVNKYGLGVECSSFNPEDMASMLNRITNDQWEVMKQAARNASAELNARVEMKKLINIYEKLLVE